MRHEGAHDDEANQRPHHDAINRLLPLLGDDQARERLAQASRTANSAASVLAAEITTSTARADAIERAIMRGVTNSTERTNLAIERGRTETEGLFLPDHLEVATVAQARAELAYLAPPMPPLSRRSGPHSPRTSGRTPPGSARPARRRTVQHHRARDPACPRRAERADRAPRRHHRRRRRVRARGLPPPAARSVRRVGLRRGGLSSGSRGGRGMGYLPCVCGSGPQDRGRWAMAVPMRLEGFSMRVSDVDRSVAFYRDQLGFTVEQQHGHCQVKPFGHRRRSESGERSAYRRPDLACTGASDGQHWLDVGRLHSVKT